MSYAIMRISKVAVAAFVLVFLMGCGDSGTDPETFDQIGGSYSGTLSGVQQGIALNATLSFTIQQNQGNLSGSYAISGTLQDAVAVVDIQGTGAIAGTIQSGNNPSVNITVTPGSCPSRQATFSGSHDTANNRLTMSGPILIMDNNCNIVMTFNSTIVMSP